MFEIQLNLYTQEKTSTNNDRDIDANARQRRAPLSLQTHLVPLPSVIIKGMF